MSVIAVIRNYIATADQYPHVVWGKKYAPRLYPFWRKGSLFSSGPFIWQVVFNCCLERNIEKLLAIEISAFKCSFISCQEASCLLLLSGEEFSSHSIVEVWWTEVTSAQRKGIWPVSETAILEINNNLFWNLFRVSGGHSVEFMKNDICARSLA